MLESPGTDTAGALRAACRSYRRRNTTIATGNRVMRSERAGVHGRPMAFDVLAVKMPLASLSVKRERLPSDQNGASHTQVASRRGRHAIR